MSKPYWVRYYILPIMILFSSIWICMCVVWLGSYPDSKVHVANMGPTWGHQVPGGPHVGHMNLDIMVKLTVQQKRLW